MFSFFKRVFRRKKKSTSSEAPPPYNQTNSKSRSNPSVPVRTSSSSTSSYLRILHQNARADITTQSTPQWNWNNAQCQLWLYLMLTEACGRPEGPAYEFVRTWEGFGPFLYSVTQTDWMVLFGQQDGSSIWLNLYSHRGSPGAVPPSVSFTEGDMD